MQACSGCGTENRPGRKFCSHCGNALEFRCGTCGAANEPGDRFCGDCGAALTTGGASAQQPAQSTGAGQGAERRLVSVLFADLVGFTTISEHGDPEEIREWLSRYFDRSRRIIERYGGTVEKFIGDAVMAVWGSPVAREDDAERAVRAGLALTQAVSALGAELGMPDLAVRVGVMTGNAAVDMSGEREGMLVGDAVNTASRLQSIAAPGTVLVDDVTRRASEAAIAYEDTGTHEVKGRDQPVHVYTALRVVAGSRGARRSVGVESPFTGRDAELHAIIDAAAESAAERRARHVAVIGEAGSGKSRLVWEFFKYVDGVKEEVWWHQGRCLSYGEGVGYWALAEIVRSRAGILEEEDAAEARAKLRATVEEHVPDERERRLVEPRLAHLLRLEERPDADRADLFSGWRLFFERMAQADPVVLVFEDLQWADSGLLDFIDYLLDWSAEFPIFVLSVGRTELRERRPGWEPLLLEPLEPQAIVTIVNGLAPGVPHDLVADVAQRADGIPLYAVELIRMLQDRGALVQEGNRYVVSGDVRELDVPETLHALVASRLDGLSPDERALLQDAAVLGHAFSAASAAELSGRRVSEVTTLLDGLVAKQILARDEDPRSPERGQYVFLQALLRTVAYGTLPRRARKARHLAAARHLEQTWPGEAADIAEVLAAHYLAAIGLDPEADDAVELRAQARRALTGAGRTAASLALGPEADRYFQQAAELAQDDAERAALFEMAGRALWQSGDEVTAQERLRLAVELFDRTGAPWSGSALVALGETLRMGGRSEEAVAVLERFRPTEGGFDPVARAEGLACLASSFGNLSRYDEAGPLLEEALAVLEGEQAWASLALALVSRGVYLVTGQRREEGAAVLTHALRLAETHDLPSVALRARFNLAAVFLDRDQLTECVEQVREALVTARERGDRVNERDLLAQMLAPLVSLGEWDEVVVIADSLLDEKGSWASAHCAAFVHAIALARGDDALRARCEERAEAIRGAPDRMLSECFDLLEARSAIDRGAPEVALAIVSAALELPSSGGEYTAEQVALGVRAALRLDDEASAPLESFFARLTRARTAPLLAACSARLAAERAHRRGEAEASDAAEGEAIGLLRSVGARPLLAETLVERSRRRDDPEALAEARAIYTDLGATRELAKLDAEAEVPA